MNSAIPFLVIVVLIIIVIFMNIGSVLIGQKSCKDMDDFKKSCEERGIESCKTSKSLGPYWNDKSNFVCMNDTILVKSCYDVFVCNTCSECKWG